jgi:hypothetical protein
MKSMGRAILQGISKADIQQQKSPLQAGFFISLN